MVTRPIPARDAWFTKSGITAGAGSIESRVHAPELKKRCTSACAWSASDCGIASWTEHVANTLDYVTRRSSVIYQSLAGRPLNRRTRTAGHRMAQRRSKRTTNLI